MRTGGKERRRLIGFQEAATANRAEDPNVKRNKFVGKTKGIGNSVKSALCTTIVYPNTEPIKRPKKPLEKTRTKAS